MVNIDENGRINPAYYENAINDQIQRLIEKYNYNPQKITSNNMLAMATKIYPALFKPDKPQKYNPKCNIPYTEYNITALLDIYINIALSYDCLPSFYTFEKMTGIVEETVKQYVTNASLAMQNTRKSYLINRLNESNIGVLTLANHEQSIGLMYNRQNILDNATVKQSLTARDLVKLPQIQQTSGIDSD